MALYLFVGLFNTKYLLRFYCVLGAGDRINNTDMVTPCFLHINSSEDCVAHKDTANVPGMSDT